MHRKGKHLWYKYHGLFVRTYIVFQQSKLLQINKKKTSREICFNNRLKSRDPSAPISVTMVRIYRNVKHLFTLITIGELTNSLWHLFYKYFPFRCTLAILHSSRMGRNVTRILYSARKNAGATPHDSA